MKHIVFIESNTCGLMGIKAAKEMGHYVTFVRSKSFESLYQHDPLFIKLDSLVDNAEEVEFSTDEEQLFCAVRRAASKHPVDAIITVLEYTVLPTANIAKKMNIPYNSPDSVTAARNKGILRKRLENRQINSTKHFSSNDPEELLEAAEKLGYPMILKPCLGSGSFYVKKISDLSQLKEAINNYSAELNALDNELKRTVNTTVILEEFLEGPMFSIEVGTVNSEFFPFSICERKRYLRDDSIELGSTMPIDLPTETYNRICEYTNSVIEALGLTMGMFHFEMIYTKNGPIIFDANPRLSGNMGPKMINLTLGIDVYKVLISMHLGERFDFPNPLNPQCYITTRPLLSETDAKFRKKADLGWLDEFGESIIDFNLYISPGDEVKQAKSNYETFGFVVVKDQSATASKKLAETVLQRIRQSLDLPIILDGHPDTFVKI